MTKTAVYGTNKHFLLIFIYKEKHMESYESEGGAKGFGGIPEWTAEQIGERKAQIDAACSAAGFANGHPVLIKTNDDVVLYRYHAAQDEEVGAANTGEPAPNCPVAVCSELREIIEEYCHKDPWLPPGAPIAIYYDGGVCYCYCR